jgi:hypothetical protein
LESQPIIISSLVCEINQPYTRQAYHILGPMTILPLRRLIIERQIQPEMLTFVSTDDVVALFNMCVQRRSILVSADRTSFAVSLTISMWVHQLASCNSKIDYHIVRCIADSLIAISTPHLWFAPGLPFY